MSENATPTVHKSTIITQLIAIFGFVVVPALITMIAPVTWLTFEKQPAGVTATARKCLFFIIAYRTETVSPLTDVSQKVARGRDPTAEEKRKGHGRQEDEGTLVLTGPQGEVKVSVSPVNLANVTEQVRAFQQVPQDTPLRMTVVANWKFSVLVGGIATFFTLLYLVGATLAIAFWMIRTFGPGGNVATASE